MSIKWHLMVLLGKTKEDNVMKETQGPKHTEKSTRNTFIVIGVVVAIFIAANYFGKNNTNEPPAQPPGVIANEVPVAPEAPSSPQVKTYALSEDAAAGSLTFNVKGTKVETETKTENQYVAVSVRYTNNDKKARDFSTSLFTLTDSAGKSYEAADYLYAIEDYLTYESLNPGISKTKYVVFETPKGISGLKLVADSSVALAGDETVTINLGI